MAKYEIRQVDAYLEEDEEYNCGGWIENTSYVLGTYETTADNKRAFLHALHKLGIVCRQGKCRVVDEFDFWTLEDAHTGEPLFHAFPINY